MNQLSRAQLDRIALHIQQTNPHQALQAELIDHVASLIEQRMDGGQAFPDAFDQAMQQANPEALAQLKQQYLREFQVQYVPVRRRNIRAKRRFEQKPFQYMLLSSVLTFLILMSFLILVSRPLAVPLASFQTALGAGMTGLMSVLLVRWWLTRRLRKSKHLLSR